MNSSVSRPEVVTALFAFLRHNQGINRDVQEGFVSEALSPATVEERALLLMHRVLQTQTLPNLDHILAFFKSITSGRGLHSCSDFRRCVRDQALRKSTARDLSVELARCPGWGPKTAALFVRNLALIQRSPNLHGRFWPDIDVMKDDEVWLPVDAVIIAIFSRLSPMIARPELNNFNRINRYLRHELGYSSTEMLVWDDLWFWGFITQRSTKGQTLRAYGWNEAKYWAIPHSPKDAASIKRIQNRAEDFLSLSSLAR
jgi:hypothetical protein